MTLTPSSFSKTKDTLKNSIALVLYGQSGASKIHESMDL